MHRSAVVFLAGLVSAALLVLVIVSTEQTPLVVALEAAAIGLLTYALTHAIRPRG